MRLVGKIFKWLAMAIVVLVVAGAIYQQVGRVMDAKLAPPRNEMIAVGGRTIHVACIGTGNQTFVLDSGLGGWSVMWWRLQPLLAKTGRACVFDRPGEGWSDSARYAHDGLAAADQLAAIVAAARIPTPFIYVGHSLGANFAQIYYARHPADIAGLVLLEPGDPKDLLEDFHGTRAEAMAAPDCDWKCYVAVATGYLGVPRLVANSTPGRHFPGSMKAQYRVGLARPSHWINFMAYFAALPKTAYETMDVRSFGDTPVLVFSTSELREPEGKETIEDVKAWRGGYLAYLRSLAAKSSRGEGPIEVPNSNHAYMALEEPQAAFVAHTIIEFMGGARVSSLRP
jgi:pimeloyl-ACP methyl ester carboxylesterase